MRKLHILLILLAILAFNKAICQEMNHEKLEAIIKKNASTVKSNKNSIQFLYKNVLVFCIYDENANRVRIISPIIKSIKLKEEQLLNMLVANFHSALDVKYALSDEIIWSVFIHPLKELSDYQVEDAIRQVYSANRNFGSTYSSTDMIFPGNTKKREIQGNEKLINKI